MEQIRLSQESKSYEELQLQYSEMVILLQCKPNYFISILFCPNQKKLILIGTKLVIHGFAHWKLPLSGMIIPTYIFETA
jgi:hypothetical protein